MNKLKVINHFNIELNTEQILTFLECGKNNPMRNTMERMIADLQPKLQELLNAEAIVLSTGFPSEIEGLEYESGKEAVFVLMYLGKKVSDYISECFANGNYMEGMVLDAMADDYVFQMSYACERELEEICSGLGKGIRRKLEAPLDMPACIQRKVLADIKQYREVPVSLTSADMFEPAKTICHILLLSDDPGELAPWHDCETCLAANCKMRSPLPIIEVLYGEQAYEIPCERTKSIYELLIERKIPIEAACAGQGRCGKCRIKVEYGEVPVSADDREVFTEQEIQAGYRLACTCYVTESCTIYVEEKQAEIKAVSQFCGVGTKPELRQGDLFIAVDIGTTTIAFALANQKNGSILHTHTRLNSQKAYGADVVSRQLAAVSGNGDSLQECIRTDLYEGIIVLLEESGVKRDTVAAAVIACNTTMGHLLMGYSCESLGKFPFTPVNIHEINLSLEAVLGRTFMEIPVKIMPGISAYVGGDIVAGLLACEFYSRLKPALLLDLGTNGEMAVGTKDSIIVSSAAAGPAFEGGNITWGTGSIPGAICRVEIKAGNVQVETIGDKPPIGLCGTGLVEAIAAMVTHNIIDHTGLLQEAYFDSGFPVGTTVKGEAIVITQKDIREFQMAKGAIRAGMEIIITQYGTSWEELDTVFLAGGFGYYMNIEKAVTVGLLPASVKDKVACVGNSSLGGGIRCMTAGQDAEKISAMIAGCEEVHLSKAEQFQEQYMEQMYF